MRKILTVTLLALIGLVSCTEKETLPTSGGGGELRIVFNTGELITKTDPLPSWNDGSGIYIDNTTPGSPSPDLVILVADASSGDIIGTYPSSNAKLEGTPTSTLMSVSIKGLGDGIGDRSVIVFAFANTEGLWAMQVPGSPATQVSDLTSLTTKTQVESLVFTPLSANTCPELIDIDPSDDEDVLDRLPLSARASTTVASNGNGEISLSMLRCVAKVTAEFVNNTGDDLTLYGFYNSFIGMCPTSGFVMAGSNPDIAGSTGNLIGEEASLFIAQESSLPKSWYVFPSTGPYTCDVHFWLNETDYLSNNTSSEDYFSYSGLEVHDDHARDLTILKRNQHLHIVTRISKGLAVSFSFQVKNWTSKTETVEFN